LEIYTSFGIFIFFKKTEMLKNVKTFKIGQILDLLICFANYRIRANRTPLLIRTP
jgi:hypothetical protein